MEVAKLVSSRAIANTNTTPAISVILLRIFIPFKNAENIELLLYENAELIFP